MKNSASSQGKGPLDLVEETCYLLRQASAATWFAYYFGALPFLLGLLYFVSDMSRSAFAWQRLPGAALGLALAFIWMKCWQAVYADRLLCLLSRTQSSSWPPSRILRLVAIQSFLQPLKFIVLPVALAILLPAAWAYAFFANLTVLGTGQTQSLRQLWPRLWRQTLLWPAQNHRMLLVYKPLFLFVLLNLAVTLLLSPTLLRMFLGVETVFAQSPWAMFNTTFLACLLALAYACLDPFLKASYVLRCFYGESLKTGLDIQAEIAALRPSPPAPAVRALILAGLIFHPLSEASAQTGSADSPSPEPNHITAAAAAAPGRRLSAEELNQSIDRVIHQRQYAWRFPRERHSQEPADRFGFLRFLRSVGDSLESGLRQVGRWIKGALEWLNLGWQPKAGPGGPGYDWRSGLRGLLIGLIAVLLVFLLVLLYRAWQRRRRVARVRATPATAAPTPDLTDEGLGADQLPEESWLRLARDLTKQGDHRLALRAYYLASLASLAQGNLIGLARFKSNHDYEQEVDRRAHALPELAGLFRENVAVFDRAWYGLHEVTPPRLNRFADNVRRIQTQIHA